MGIKDRLRRLEQRRGAERCPECGSRSRAVKVLWPDDSRSGDVPCSTCGNAAVVVRVKYDEEAPPPEEPDTDRARAASASIVAGQEEGGKR